MLGRGNTVVISAVLLAVMAGCSGGGEKDSVAPTTSTVAASSSQPSTTTPPGDLRFTGQDSAQFCEMARTYNAGFTGLGSSPTPAQLRTATREGQTAIAQSVNLAPAEIKKDLEVLAATFGGLLVELEKVGFEVAKVPPASLTPLTSAEFQSSTARFQTYVRTVCGVN